MVIQIFIKKMISLNNLILNNDFKKKNNLKYNLYK